MEAYCRRRFPSPFMPYRNGGEISECRKGAMRMTEEESVDRAETPGKDGEECGTGARDAGSRFDLAAVLRKLGDHITGAFT